MSESGVVAFTWFLKGEYRQLLEIAEDTESFFDSYEAWKKDARETLMKLKKMGFDPRRVYIKTEEFEQWCHRRSQKINGESLEMFKEIKRQSFYAQLDESGPDQPPGGES